MTEALWVALAGLSSIIVVTWIGLIITFINHQRILQIHHTIDSRLNKSLITPGRAEQKQVNNTNVS